MARSPRDSFRSLTGPGAPYLHPSSVSFGSADAGAIERSFVDVAGRFHRELLSLTASLASGSIALPGFYVRSRTAIRVAYFTAYSLGAISIFPFYTITDRDIGILNDELNEEIGFLRKFAADITHDRLGLDLVSRAGLYLLALRGIFERGRLKAMPTGPYRWRLGIEDTCVECVRASLGGPYQRSRRDHLGFPTLPGSPGDGSVCLGLTRCGCTITLASGIELPNADLVDRLRSLLTSVLNSQ